MECLRRRDSVPENIHREDGMHVMQMELEQSICDVVYEVSCTPTDGEDPDESNKSKNP